MGNINLQGICAQLPPLAHLLIWAAYLLWEYGLGKTNFGSSVGLFIEAPVNKVLSWLHLNNGPQ